MDAEVARFDAIDNKNTAPFRSPTAAGGLFSIDREFFFHLGGYDLKMDFWGNENVELSLLVCTST